MRETSALIVKGRNKLNISLVLVPSISMAKLIEQLKNIIYWYRNMMTNAALHWPVDNADSVQLWSFTVTHVAWLYNHLPNKNLGWMSPVNIFTKTLSDYQDLLRTRVWGCPAFVLHPKLHYSQNIPKFNRQSCVGQFLGFSDEHSTLVAMVKNLATHFVSPRFYVVFYENLSSIQNNTRIEDTAVEAVSSIRVVC